MKEKKLTFKANSKDFVGNLILSATGLRRMANALQKHNKTKDDVTVKVYIHKWYKSRKLYKTLGIKVK